MKKWCCEQYISWTQDSAWILTTNFLQAKWNKAYHQIYSIIPLPPSTSTTSIRHNKIMRYSFSNFISLCYVFCIVCLTFMFCNLSCVWSICVFDRKKCLFWFYVMFGWKHVSKLMNVWIWTWFSHRLKKKNTMIGITFRSKPGTWGILQLPYA